MISRISFITAAIALTAFFNGHVVHAADPVEVITPFVDKHTMAIARIQLEHVDSNAIIKTIYSSIEDEAERQRMESKSREDLETKLTVWRDTGAKELYFVASLMDFGGQPYIVAPDVERTDEALLQAIEKEIGIPTSKLGKAIVAAPPKTIERLRTLEGEIYASLSQALSAVDQDADIQFAIALPADAIRVIEEMAPQLPPEIGGGPITNATQSIQWIAGSIHLPPKMSATVRIEASHVENRAKIETLINNIFEFVGKNAKIAGVTDWPQISNALKPEIADNSMIIELDENEADKLLNEWLAKPMREARESAKRMVMMSNARQIAVSVFAYGIESKNVMPEHFVDVVQHIQDIEVFLPPNSGIDVPENFQDLDKAEQKQWLDKHAAFILVPGLEPLNKIENAAETIMIIEKLRNTNSKDVMLAFTDGHVERVLLNDANSRVKNQTGKTVAEWSRLK